MLRKWIVLPLALLMTLAVVNCGDAAPAKAEKAAKAAEPKVTALSTLKAPLPKGKVTFVELWGVWCPPCVRSMPHIQEVWDKYKTNKNFNLMVVNTGWRGDDLAKVKGWVGANAKYTFPVYFEDRPEAQQFAVQNQVNSIPRSLVFDKQGKLQYNGHPMEMPADLLDKLLKQ